MKMKGLIGVSLLLAFSVHPSRGKTVWFSPEESLFKGEESLTGSGSLGDSCTFYTDCRVENTECIDSQCRCIKGLTKSAAHDEPVCVPEKFEVNIEHEKDMSWHDNLLDQDSQEYQALATEIEERLKELYGILLLHYSVPNLRESGLNKVTADVVVVYRNPDTTGRQRRSTGDRERRFPFDIISNGYLGDPCPCDGSIANIRCKHGFCQCKNNLVWDTSVDKRTCYDTKSLMENCTIEAECRDPFQECKGSPKVCDCISTHVLFDVDRAGPGCYELRDNLDDRCTIHQQCQRIQYSRCLGGKCLCGSGFEDDRNGGCTGRVGLGGECSSSPQCREDNSECREGTCTCVAGYRQSGAGCVPEMNLCADRGGFCVPKGSRCCPEKMGDDATLCPANQRCCLPAPTSGLAGEPPVGPCECSARHEQVLGAAQNDFQLQGNTIYNPASQVPHGATNRHCLPTEAACGGDDVCLKRRVLNLLECAADACDGKTMVWKLVSLLNSNACDGTDCKNLCDGKGVLFELKDTSCPINNMKSMCEDTLGTYTEQGGFVWCTY